MADITEYLRKIESAARGEDVRDAIIGALNTINSSGGNAYTLNGIAWDKFAKQATLDAILPADTEPTANSTKMVTSGGIYDYLLKASNALDKINYGSNQSHTGSTIKQKIEVLNDIKRQLKNALRAKQVEVEDSDGLSSYADKIESITINDSIEVSSITITENGEYDAAKGKSVSSDKGYAYNPITVDVKPKVTDKSISTNGTFKASDDGYDGYSSVDVDVSSSLITLEVTSEDMPDDPSETKVFRIDDNQDPEKIGYNEVSINVGGKFGTKELEVDPSAGVRQKGSDGSYAVEQTVEASSENIWGWNKIHITIKESEGPFTVRFMMNNSVLQEVTNVPKNGYARYTKETPKKEGHTFTGWNPNPVNVTSNLDCYAQFEEEDESSAGDGVETTSLSGQSWQQIVADGGYNCQVGDTITMSYGSFTYLDVEYEGQEVIATCTGKHEGGATSIWSFPVKFVPLYSLSNDTNFIGTNKISELVKTSESSLTGYRESELYKLSAEIETAISKHSGEEYMYFGMVANRFVTYKMTNILKWDGEGNFHTTEQMPHVWSDLARDQSRLRYTNKLIAKNGSDDKILAAAIGKFSIFVDEDLSDWCKQNGYNTGQNPSESLKMAFNAAYAVNNDDYTKYSITSNGSDGTPYITMYFAL